LRLYKHSVNGQGREWPLRNRQIRCAGAAADEENDKSSIGIVKSTMNVIRRRTKFLSNNGEIAGSIPKSSHAARNRQWQIFCAVLPSRNTTVPPSPPL
jgi:hypothetical protein